MIYNRDDEAIVARCTPQGAGALALLRLSGKNALAVADTCITLTIKKSVSSQKSHTIHTGYVVDSTGKTVDQVMVSIMHGPRTFTGQDTVEITCHNNPIIIEEILTSTIKAGARCARNGEFTQRAFMNGKIDLTKAEAINELIHAQNQLSLTKSLAQLHGSLSSWIATIEQELVRALAWSEASFEFLENEGDFGHHIRDHLSEICQTIGNIKKSFHMHKQVREGIRVAFIGSVNAGKSSLFNALLDNKRAIVSQEPGTTRDTIEAVHIIHGTITTLVDTAGIRPTADHIEVEGINRSYTEAKRADIILLVYDNARILHDDEKDIYQDILTTFLTKTIVIQNKTDLPQESDFDVYLQKKGITPIAASHDSKNTLTKIANALESKIIEISTTFEAPFLLNKRHYNLLESLESKLLSIITMLSTSPIHYELISFHLRECLEYSTELTGKSIDEAGMDAVFREFCVGK